MIDSVPLIQDANDAQQINASIIAMKKASRELDEKIVKLNSLNSELDKKIALLDSGLNKEIEDRKEAINSLDVASVGGSGKYISAISETDGKISATASDITSSVSSGNSQPVTSGGVANAIANKVERYLFARDGVIGKRYVLLGTANGSSVTLTSMSCDIFVTARDSVNQNYSKFTIHLDINFQNAQSILSIKGWTDAGITSNYNKAVAVVITKQGTTSYLYLDCTEDWFSFYLIPITSSLQGTFTYNLPMTEEANLIGDIVFNSRTDPTKITQLYWNVLDISYTATQESTTYTKIKDDIPDFNEALIITNYDTLVIKRCPTLNVSYARSYAYYTPNGAWDVAYEIQINWDTHKMYFRQLKKGSSATFANVKEMYYR